MLGARPGDSPFDGQPDVKIDNTLGVATITGDTTGVGAGDGDYTFVELEIEAVGPPGFTAVDVTKVEFRDKTGAIIPDVTATTEGVSITEPPAVPGLASWTMVTLAGVLPVLIIWETRRRRRWAAKGSH